MKRYGEIEQLLADLPAPDFAETQHRARLKADLIEAMQRKENTTMVTWKRLALACGIVLAIVAVGWAAQEVARKFVVEDSNTEKKTVHPDGSVTVRGRNENNESGKDKEREQGALLDRRFHMLISREFAGMKLQCCFYR